MSDRPGYGCFTTLAVLLVAGFVVIGATLALGLLRAGEDGATLVLAIVIAGLIALMVWLLVSRRRTREEEDAAADGAVTSTRGSAPGRPSAGSEPEPVKSASDRSSPLRTQPEDPASQKLKQRLAEAVSELAEEVEEQGVSAESRDRPGSEEMIARAKRRIADRGCF